MSQAHTVMPGARDLWPGWGRLLYLNRMFRTEARMSPAATVEVARGGDI